MTVVFRKEEEKSFTANDVLWAKEDLVDSVVRNVLVGQTEAFVEMLIDCQSQMEADELGRSGIQAGLHDVKLSAEDFIEDVVNDLRKALLARLKETNFGAAVTCIKYGLAGDIKDIVVDITVS